jgi:hypothetical protein
MRLFAIIIFAVFVSEKVGAQTKDSTFFTPYTIVRTLDTRLAKLKRQSQFSHPLVADGFWLLITGKDFADDFGNINPKNFFDTLQTLYDVVCDCMIKNDTIYLQGGIAYEAGAGFDLRIVGNLFNARIWVAGKRFWINDSVNIKQEILLNSVSQSLKIQNRNSLRLGKKMIGELLFESEDFFEENDTTPDKFYLKLIFGCKLNDSIDL